MEFAGEKLNKDNGTIDEKRRLQKELKGLGHYPKKIDGDYGDGTVDAVKDFQKANKLPQTGEVDKATGAAINKAYDALPQTPALPGAPTPAQAEDVSALIEQVEKLNAILEKLIPKDGTPEQKKKFEELEKKKAEILLKALEKALKQLDKLITWQIGITATREGTKEEKGIKQDTTAFGFSAAADKFVALPCKSARGKWIELTLENGATAIVPVGDVGPHYENDCYWEKDRRPKAETEGETRNHAGIDISQNLWVQLGLDAKAGMTKLDWRFVDRPADGQVDMTDSTGKKIKHVNVGGK